jgi:hypothetical protein
MQTKIISELNMISKAPRRTPVPVWMMGDVKSSLMDRVRPGHGLILLKCFILLAACFASSIICAHRSAVVPLLRDGDFESSTPNGSFPDSGAWKPSWLGEAGAVCTTTAGRAGAGLWAYTGTAAADIWSEIYQELSAKSGEIYSASVFVRTPEGGAWVAGSKAGLEVRFLDIVGRVLSIVAAQPLTTPATEWSHQNIVTPPAPSGTVKVRLVLLVAKPQDVGGQSIANFDDASLSLSGLAKLSDSPVVSDPPKPERRSGS